MWTNINNVAVYPPPKPCITKTMSHPSPNHSGNAKGSYEMYDSQRRSSDFQKDNMLNTSVGSVAPGSPGTTFDYKQAVAKLQKEVEDRKRKEAELQDVITSLRASQSHTSTSFDSQLMNLDEPPGSENMGENVKDAHLKHLQRQVTVLQANLYKTEGWKNRAAVVIQERDKAVDDASQLSQEVRRLQEENHELRRKQDELLTSLREMQQKVAQLQAEIENRNQNGPSIVALQEEAKKHTTEIKTLRESVSRLEQENRSLKECPTNPDSTQVMSMGNVACSRELEYLHKVVNTLKSTVLEQRTFLLAMRNSSGNPRSLPMSSSHVINGSSLTGRNLPTPQTQTSGWTSSESDVMIGPQDVFGLPVQGAGVPRIGGNGTLLEPRPFPQRNGSAPELGIEGRVNNPVGRRLSSRECVTEASGMDPGTQKMPPFSQADGSAFQPGRTRQEVGLTNRPSPHILNRDGYINHPINNASSASLIQQANGLSAGMSSNGDMALPPKPLSSAALAMASGYVPMLAPQHYPLQRKTSQSEVLGRRNVLELGNSDQNRSKSETIGRNPEMLPQDGRRPPQWKASSAMDFDRQSVNNNTINMAQLEPSPILSQQQRFVPTSSAMQAQQEVGARRFEGTSVPWDSPEQALLWDRQQNKLPANLVASSTQAQAIFHPPTSYPASTVRMTNQDMMSGSQTTVPVPTAHRPTPSATQANLYINVHNETGQAESSVDPELTRPRMKSDRLCPVCSKDYSHISMEDFQTHVFECFDDENAPETMKPQESLDRTCPMCNVKFGPNTTQTDYEKHVHSHFGEEGPGDHFEILQ